MERHKAHTQKGTMIDSPEVPESGAVPQVASLPTDEQPKTICFNMCAMDMIIPAFCCEYEFHNLQEFQADNHFVAGLKDENGFRRPWYGDEVHILTLRHKGEQQLRMMADSLEEVSKLMAAEIPRTFNALWLAQFLQGFSHDAFVKQWDRLADLERFINEQYEHEIDRGQHGNFQDLIAVAMYYMGKERELTHIYSASPVGRQRGNSRKRQR